MTDRERDALIRKALDTSRVPTAPRGTSIGMDGVPKEMIEALDAVASDLGMDRTRTDVIWRALKVYLTAYLYTRENLNC